MITPAQLRNAAKFEQTLPKETLLELADYIENRGKCNQPVEHEFLKWENVSQTDTEWQWLRQCKHCEVTQMKRSKPMEVG